MVKPDPKHNYYSDLELPATATIEEIRKAYRKLALQYHPDRNAGRETECVPRFQAIQAANEVLSDPATKAQYDQDRRKASLYPSATRASGPSGNPYQATSAYPPPPRRTQPGTWQRPTPSTGASASGSVPTGADRFANFGRPGSSNSPRNPAADRSQQFHAWQKMNSGPNRNTARPTPPPPPPREQPSPQPPPPPRARPGMPTEEKIRASFAHRAPPPAPEVDERATAWQHWKAQQAKEPQQKKKDGAENLRRSNTQRTPKSSGGYDPNAPGSDERPAPTTRYSHRHRSEDLGTPMKDFPPPPPRPPTGSSPTSPLSPGGSARPAHGHSPNPSSPLRPPFRSRTTDDKDAPYTEGNRKSTPYSHTSGQLPRDAGGIFRSASTKDTTRLHPNSAKSGRAQSSSPPGQFTPRSGKPNFVNYSSSDESDAEHPFSTTPEEASDAYISTNKASNAASSNPQSRPIKTPAPPSRRFTGSKQASQYAESQDGTPNMQQRPSGTNIFTVPDLYTASVNTAKSRSEETINTNFSPGGWSGTFTGGDYFASPATTTPRKSSPSRRPVPRSGQRPATTDASTGNGTSARSAGEEQIPAVPPRNNTSTADGKFDFQQWEQAFKDGSWAFPPPPPNPPINRSTSNNAQTGSATTTGTKDDPHVVDSGNEDAKRESHYPPPPSSNDVEPMDIDTPPTAQVPQGPDGVAADAGKGARLYSVPPSAWRQQQAKDSRKSSGRKAQRPPATVADATLATSLDDLVNVEPIGKPTEGHSSGLKNLADLSATLPFQSSAAPQISTSSSEPQLLQMPLVPQAPEGPVRLSKATWHAHAQNFARYLAAFHAFNRTMLAHFDAREMQAQARMSGGMAWLEAIGDVGTGTGAVGIKGFAEYLKGVREDEAVRETWKLGCEKHADAVKEFDRLRERVRKMVASNALAEV